MFCSRCISIVVFMRFSARVWRQYAFSVGKRHAHPISRVSTLADEQGKVHVLHVHVHTAIGRTCTQSTYLRYLAADATARHASQLRHDIISPSPPSSFRFQKHMVFSNTHFQLTCYHTISSVRSHGQLQNHLVNQPIPTLEPFYPPTPS